MNAKEWAALTGEGHVVVSNNSMVAGVGADSLATVDPNAQLASSPVPNWWTLLSAVGAATGAYHGYKRNNSVGWGLGWFLFGGALPVFSIPLSIAEGFGKPEKEKK